MEIDALKWLILNNLFNNGTITMHEHATIAEIHTEGDCVAFVRHTTERRKHIIPKNVVAPAASPTMSSAIIFCTDSWSVAQKAQESDDCWPVNSSSTASPGLTPSCWSFSLASLKTSAKTWPSNMVKWVSWIQVLRSVVICSNSMPL